MGDLAARREVRVRKPSRGQSETLGVVLLLGITVIGAMAVVAFGATALEDARGASGHESVGHAMTQFDSRAAIVALGDGDTQSVRLGGSGGGTYTVKEDAGWMNVTHVNHSGSDQAQAFINTSLGSFVYEGDDVEIAYQGGGVWRKQNGGSVMVSPPEFHYRDATLTLPIIRVNGSASASGSVRADVTNRMSARPVFPNASAAPYDGNRYLNPVTDGNVTVTVHSEYYEAWADYFRSRSEGEVEVHDNNQTVELTLATGSVVGEFTVPNEGNSLSVTRLDEEHPLDEFNITLKADNDGQNFNNMHWSLYAEEGSEDFELHVYSPDKCSGGSYSGELDVSVYYYNGTTDYYQGWQNSSIDPSSDKNFDVDCDDYTLTANFTGDTPMEYKKIDMSGSDNKWYFGSDISSYSVVTNATVDQHDIDTESGRNGRFNASNGETDSMKFVVNHYFSLMGPSFDLTIADGPGGSDRIDESASTGTLYYQQTEGSVITFLHITENRIRVETR